MKLNVEVEISPEEMRRLVGLPDMQPIYEGLYKRVADGDSELIQHIAKTTFTEGMKTIDMSARFLKSLGGLATKVKSGSDDDADSSEKKGTKAKPKTSRRSSSDNDEE